MKKLLVLLCISAVLGCSTEKKETIDFAELLKVRESIEKGSGKAILQYEEILDSSLLSNIAVDPKFIALKNQAVADLNDLIAQALEQGVDRQTLIDCIKENGADSPECEQFVQQVKSNTSPRMKQFDADLGKFIANHLNENSHLPKATGNCRVLHDGSFKLLQDGDTLSITRTEGFQVEQFRGDRRKEKITWINDCTYRIELIKEESQIADLQGVSEFLDDSFVEIIRVGEDYYVYKLFNTVDNQEGELVDIGKVYINK